MKRVNLKYLGLVSGGDKEYFLYEVFKNDLTEKSTFEQ